MKKTIFYFLLLVLFCHSCSDDTNVTYERQGWRENINLYGDIQSYAMYCYDVEDKFGELVESLQEKVIYKFNERGDVSEAAIYDNKGLLAEKLHCKYNSNFQLIEEAMYDDTGTRSDKTIYKYNTNGKLISKTLLYDNLVEEKIVYNYNPKGYIENELRYDKEGVLREKVQYKYATNGKLIEQSVFYDCSLYEKLAYKYNKDGLLLEVAKYNNRGELEIKHIYEYNTKGKVIESATYEDDGIQNRVCFKYENNKIIEDLLYNSDDRVYRKVSHKRDSRGNIIESITYDSEAMIPQILKRVEITYRK